MKLFSLLAIGGLASSVAARSSLHVKKTELVKPQVARPDRRVQNVKRQYGNKITTEASKSMLLELRCNGCVLTSYSRVHRQRNRRRDPGC